MHKPVFSPARVRFASVTLPRTVAPVAFKHHLSQNLRRKSLLVIYGGTLVAKQLDLHVIFKFGASIYPATLPHPNETVNKLPRPPSSGTSYLRSVTRYVISIMVDSAKKKGPSTFVFERHSFSPANATSILSTNLATYPKRTHC
jgi:hypothetical protein